MEQVVNERPFFESPQINQQQTSTDGTSDVFGVDFQDLSRGWYPKMQTNLTRPPVPTSFLGSNQPFQVTRGNFAHQRSFNYHHYEPGSRPVVCRNFIQGKCSYGAACKFQHSNSHNNGGFRPIYGGEYLGNSGIAVTFQFSRGNMDDGSRKRPFSQVCQNLYPNITHVRPRYDRGAQVQEFPSVLGNPNFGKRHVDNISSFPNNGNYVSYMSYPRGQMNRTPCRYFLNGTCFRGATCPYLHTTVFGTPFYDSGIIPRPNQQHLHTDPMKGILQPAFSQENQGTSSKRASHSFDDGKNGVKLCRKLIMGRCDQGESCQYLHSYHAAYARPIGVVNEQLHLKSSTPLRDSGVPHQSSVSSKDLEPTETQGDDKLKQDNKGLMIDTCEISTPVGDNNAEVTGLDSIVSSEKNHTSAVVSIMDEDSDAEMKIVSTTGESEKTEAIEAYSRKRKRKRSKCMVNASKQETLLVQIDDSLSQAATLVSKRKLLVLDLNGILVDIKWNCTSGPKPDIIVSQKAVFKRPFCDDFLEFCFERFDVGVWSSRVRKNLDKVIDFVMGDSKKRLLFCWDQSHCTQTGFNTRENRQKPLVLKELRKLWEKRVKDLPWERGYYDETNTVLLDDSPYKALRNPPNTAIFLHPYSCEMVADHVLGPDGDLRKHLIKLSEADNIQQFIEENPFGQVPITESSKDWGFYRRIAGPIGRALCGKDEPNEGTLPEKKVSTDAVLSEQNGFTDGTSAVKNGSTDGMLPEKNKSIAGALNGSINEALPEKSGSTNDLLPEKDGSTDGELSDKNGSTDEVALDKSGSGDGILTMKRRKKRRKTNKTPSVVA